MPTDTVTPVRHQSRVETSSLLFFYSPLACSVFTCAQKDSRMLRVLESLGETVKRDFSLPPHEAPNAGEAIIHSKG